MGASSGGAKYDKLENKWTTIVKLQKQLLDLDKQNKQLKDAIICEKCGGGIVGTLSMNKTGALGDGLPKEPEKYKLEGH
jgi:hypothetical protein